MPDRDGRHVPTTGGLIALAITAALALGASWTVWWYTAPSDPKIAPQQASESPPQGYRSGGPSCAPERIAALPRAKQPDKRIGCANAAEDHRIQSGELAQAARANDLAERNLGLVVKQDRAASVQAVTTTLAFFAAAVAAFVAWLALGWAREAAIHTQASADTAKDSLKADHRGWLSIRDVAVNGDLTFYKGNAGLPIRYRLENAGTAPAIEYLLFPKVVAIADQGQIPELIAGLVDEYSRVKMSSVIAQRVPAHVVFPSQRQIAREELIFDLKVAAMPFGQGRLFSPLIILVGCYRSPGDETVRYSSAVFTVHVDNAAYAMPPDDDGSLVTVSRDRLQLARWFTGWQAR